MKDQRLVSQSFLGGDSDARLASAEAGIVGLGGGGSHVVQQLAHLGVGKFVPVDHDVIEFKNLNRLAGGTLDDVKAGRAKTEIAERVIRAVNPDAIVDPRRSRWQQSLESLRRCSVIFGCIDSFRERDELEQFCRRFLIPYIDVGMDVHESSTGFIVSGQTVLSTPGGVCLRCLGILTDDRIKLEAAKYGQAGSRPQVVWVNGVLASLAVGLFAQLVCPWHETPIASACCEFDGNRHRVESNRLDHMAGIRCRHYPAEEVGDAFFSLT